MKQRKSGKSRAIIPVEGFKVCWKTDVISEFLLSFGQQTRIEKERKMNRFNAPDIISNSQLNIIGAAGEKEVAEIMGPSGKLKGLDTLAICINLHAGRIFQEK